MGVGVDLVAASVCKSSESSRAARRRLPVAVKGAALPAVWSHRELGVGWQDPFVEGKVIVLALQSLVSRWRSGSGQVRIVASVWP